MLAQRMIAAGPDILFNLLVSGSGWKSFKDTIEQDRVFEYTEEQLVNRFKKDGMLDTAALMALPTLFVSEATSESTFSPSVGFLTDISKRAGRYELSYNFDTSLPLFTKDALVRLSDALGIGDWELNRTHWAIKNVDLFRVLMAGGSKPTPTVFQLGAPVDKKLVGVMMPFNAEFDNVYDDLREAVIASGKRCQRADDMWKNNAVIQDIVELIESSAFVICDLTGKNPNVFYETGIAHTLGKSAILITQSEADVPFNLRHLRFLKYLDNAEGRRRLVAGVLARISTIESASL